MPSPNCPNEITEIPNLLTAEVCTTIIEQTRPRLTSALVGRGIMRIPHPARVCDNYKYRVDTVWSKNLRAVVAMKTDVDIDYVEPVEVIRYPIGGCYYRHHDGIDRSHSLHISLNNDFKGGELFFNELGAFFSEMPIGLGLWWNNQGRNMVHEYRPITEGERWVVCVWTSLYNSEERKTLGQSPETEKEPASPIYVPPTYDKD